MAIHSINAIPGELLSATSGPAHTGPKSPGAWAVANVLLNPLPGRGGQAQELSATALQAIARDWQGKIAAVAPELEFSVDQGSGRPMVRVVDRSTGELIRQIPSEEVLALSQAIDALQKRLMPDQEA